MLAIQKRDFSASEFRETLQALEGIRGNVRQEWPRECFLLVWAPETNHGGSIKGIGSSF